MDKEAAWLLKDKYNGLASSQFEADLARLEAGELLAYVIGWVPFLGAKIYLDSLPLIPRAETEYWVSGAIDEIKKYQNEKIKEFGTENIKNIKVLDLCAGSGCIGVAVLKNIDGVQVDFVEIDTAHHKTILKNVIENGIDIGRAKIFGGNLFENINGQLNQKYDFILTNPPYIDPELVENVQQSVLNNEPHIALFGGIGGTQIINEILQNAPSCLNEKVVLYIEHEPEQAPKIKELLPGSIICKDQYDINRYSIFRKY